LNRLLTVVRTSVSVPDRGTLMMGGQRLVTEVETEQNPITQIDKALGTHIDTLG
jgi:hypothetical protein